MRAAARLAALERRLSAIEREPLSVVPEPWHVVGSTGEPAWGPGTWAGSSWAAFFKDPHGVVHLKGELFCTAATNNPAFVLPVGYRPSRDISFPLIYWAGSRIAGIVSIRASSGNVDVTGNADTFTTNVNYAGISHIQFRAD